jgi:hypothetical protein
MRAKIVKSAAEVKKQLQMAQGNLAYAASQMRVSRSWLYSYINAHPTVKEALEDIREAALDRAETMLQARMAESDTLLIFFLKTQGHKRGYTERHEITGADGKDLFDPAALVAAARRMDDNAR